MTKYIAYLTENEITKYGIHDVNWNDYVMKTNVINIQPKLAGYITQPNFYAYYGNTYEYRYKCFIIPGTELDKIYMNSQDECLCCIIL